MRQARYDTPAMKARCRLLRNLMWIGLFCLIPSAVRAGDAPAWMPRYDLAVRLDVAGHLVTATEKVIWTNRHQRRASEVVFNAHAHYSIPKKDVGFLAKTVELLRMAPSEALFFDGAPLEVQKVTLLTTKPADSLADEPIKERRELKFTFADDNVTALKVDLPQEVGPGESVNLELEFTLKLPQRKGRWGQWQEVTSLAQWLPVLAYYDDKGWQPAPFVPWHQPFFNEAGVYSARITLPADQKLACTGVVRNSKDVEEGWKEVEIEPLCVRDFAILCSPRFEEHVGEVAGVKVRCLALPQHAWYGKKAVEYACEAIPVYNRWFGPYPYGQFTIVEAHFGWNGNECGSLVMIDERMFGMPHMAEAYIDYLVSHELCHQWWYNVVGTNGYAETWMDEGLATYFSHRLSNQKRGKNNTLLAYPRGLGWLPNIHREDFRNYSYLGVQGRGQAKPTIGDLPDFGHLVNLSAMTYDRGSRIVGLIEQRLGEEAFFDFMRRVYDKYQYRILRVADFRQELEAYTGRSWETFFQQWLYETGSTDWAIKKVEFDDDKQAVVRRKNRGEKTKVKIHVENRGPNREPTVLGIRLEGQEGYQIRIPISETMQEVDLPEVSARIRNEVVPVASPPLPMQPPTHGKVQYVEVELPGHPAQITIDPDGVLLDSNPTNNHWKNELRWRPTPLYTQFEEADVTNAHDRWNCIFGPWIFVNSYNDPWYSRSPMFGLRAGAYRTQEFYGGAFLAYRANDSNIIVGGEAYWDHVPLPNTQIGINVEHAIATLGPDRIPSSRGVVFGRYIMMYGSALYLPPFEYVEAFAAFQNRSLPDPRIDPPGGDPFDQRPTLGLHYHKYYLTPYWDPEGGFALDAAYQLGLPIFGNDRTFHLATGQVSTVKYLPSWLTGLSDGPVSSYLKETRLAFRLGGAGGLPSNGQFFALGGGDQFRGFRLADRQGNVTWVGSVEWRLPIARHLCWDFCDHLGGVRNIYLAPFYDVGNAYLNGKELAGTAHALGVGLRVDVSWLGLIERTMLRLDIAQTLHSSAPLQMWFGIQHPF